MKKLLLLTICAVVTSTVLAGVYNKNCKITSQDINLATDYSQKINHEKFIQIQAIKPW